MSKSKYQWKRVNPSLWLGNGFSNSGATYQLIDRYYFNISLGTLEKISNWVFRPSKEGVDRGLGCDNFITNCNIFKRRIIEKLETEDRRRNKYIEAEKEGLVCVDAFLLKEVNETLDCLVNFYKAEENNTDNHPEMIDANKESRIMVEKLIAKVNSVMEEYK